MELAQCADPSNCELPSTLPWYFSLAMLAVWAVMVAGVVVLSVALIRARSARRRSRRRPLSDSTDIEVRYPGR
ncbi:MAG: hypothetical protein ACRDZW_05715 [Acidimicrobiales bacterium]